MAKSTCAGEQSKQHPQGSSADERTGGRTLAERFRRHADTLTRSHRSPLSAALMYGGADDFEAGGTVARLFAPVATPPGSVPQLRLLAALHHLVLAGQAPELAQFYPSVGGREDADNVWPAARAVAEQHFDWIQDRLTRTVQTNEPGRSTVLYPALLQLTLEHHLPIRLLEIGASAGLNLLVDRYCYVASNQELGDPDSPVRFEEPWQPGPPIDLRAGAEALQITYRAGCDQHPLQPADPADRTTILSYIWPDEIERFQRIADALDIAAADPPPVAAASASQWLAGALEQARADELAVVWQSVFRQYLDAEEWRQIEAAVGRAIQANPAARIVWLMMEPGEDHLAGMKLSRRTHPDERERLLASCGDHGPPVLWIDPADDPPRD
jgi:hypothetical protein